MWVTFYTILLDSMRLLKARALFWTSIVISCFIALLYISISFKNQECSIFFGAISFPMDELISNMVTPEAIYVGIFNYLIVGLWLSFGCIGLGLITCAPIFPDFMAEGSIDIALSKPISRWRLFIQKYLSSLLFIVLQTLGFVIIVFIAIRWRLGYWNPSVFWSVPLIVLMFSYLYAVMTLVGVKTKSVLMSLIITFGVWFASSMIYNAEQALSQVVSERVPFSDKKGRENQEQLKLWHQRIQKVLFILPKTTATIELLGEKIKLQQSKNESVMDSIKNIFSSPNQKNKKAISEKESSRFWYVIGTSLLFEGLMLSIAGWIFVRRDF